LLVIVPSALAAIACSSSSPDGSGPPPGVDAGTGRDANRDAAARDLGEYDRPPPTPAAAGHAWQVKDIGAGASGALRLTSGLATITAGGTGPGGAADGLSFVYQKARGDFELVARVRSLQMTDPEAIAGVAVRADDSTPGAAGLLLGILGDPGLGGRVVVRRAAGAVAEASPPDLQIRAGQFLRIERQGRRFTLSRSSDRVAWVKLQVIDLDLPAEAAVGVAASARAAGMTTTAEVDHLRLLAADAAAVAQGWQLDPLTGIGQAAALAGGNLTLTAAGDGFTTTAEVGTTVAAPVSGPMTLTARIDSLGSAATPRARVALMFREGAPGRLSTAARHALISLTAGGVVQFQRRDRSTNFEPGQMRAMVRPPIWLRLVRFDDPATFRSRITALTSADGVSWAPLDAADLALADPGVAGVIFTTGDSRTHDTVRLSGLALAATAGPPPAGPVTDAGAPPPADAREAGQ
jgi:hypothetical protein